MAQIVPVTTPDELATARSLFHEYAMSIEPFASASLLHQRFEDELASLPGRYAPPAGCILLVLDETGPIGCGAFRPLDGDACEMKRVYIRPAARARGLGRTLCQELIRRAARAGYRTMKLDTEPAMHAAQRLYRELGFVPIPRYNDSPHTVHLGLVLPAMPDGDPRQV